MYMLLNHNEEIYVLDSDNQLYLIQDDLKI